MELNQPADPRILEWLILKPRFGFTTNMEAFIDENIPKEPGVPEKIKDAIAKKPDLLGTIRRAFGNILSHQIDLKVETLNDVLDFHTELRTYLPGFQKETEAQTAAIKSDPIIASRIEANIREVVANDFPEVKGMWHYKKLRRTHLGVIEEYQFKTTLIEGALKRIAREYPWDIMQQHAARILEKQACDIRLGKLNYFLDKPNEQ